MGALQYFSQKNLPTPADKQVALISGVFVTHAFRIGISMTLHALTLSVSVTL
jgi:hypothetical protein